MELEIVSALSFLKKWKITRVGAAALALIALLSTFLWPLANRAAASPFSGDAESILNDALLPPDVALMSLGFDSAAPGYYQTSEYLIGHVAVGLIFPESNGAREEQKEDWTDDEIERVQAEVQAALDWWASLEPAAHLTFTVETHVRVPTGYEPITHRLGEERLWIAETLAALGFENSSYFAAVRDYANDLRERAGSDWAFAIFVADSSADGDGRFADGYFAYAYIGGPYMVMTTDNSGYSINNMDAVAAHEMGHIFRALDQYAAAGMKCDYQSGYLGVKNGNSLAGGDCESDAPSIMRGGVSPFLNGSVDFYARGQVGWWDSDADGVLDPVDAAPEITAHLDAVEGENADLLTFSGQAWQAPVPSPNLSDVSISRIASVGARVDGAAWTEATPTDGAFDTLSETFRLQVGPLAPGLHTLEIQAVNMMGLASAAIATTTFIYDPVDGALNSSLIQGPAAAASSPLRFEGLATSAFGNDDPTVPTLTTVQFRVDGSVWQDATPVDGAFDGTLESFELDLGDLSNGSHTLTVRAVDSQGRVETNVTERQFEIHTTFSLFLPLVQR